MMLCLVLLLKENDFKWISLNNDKWELGPLLGGETVFFNLLLSFIFIGGQLHSSKHEVLALYR